MKLIFLGSGSAFTVGDNNYHSNMLLEDPDKNRLLIDCGSDARLSLYTRGLTYRDITDVYISHLHADHAGGLEWLAFTKKFDLIQQPKPILYISEDLVDELWKNVLSGGLSSLQDTVADLSTYFTVKPIAKQGSFRWGNLDFNTIQTVHIYNGSNLSPSYGLMFNANGLTCLITTDTQFVPEHLMNLYKRADIIFHDCETSEKISYVHAHYNELTTLDPAIKAKMWLYHYNPGPLPDAVAAGFRGFVKPGQCFDFTDKNTLT